MKIKFPLVSSIFIWAAFSESMIFETMLNDQELGFGNTEKYPSDVV